MVHPYGKFGSVLAAVVVRLLKLRFVVCTGGVSKGVVVTDTTSPLRLGTVNVPLEPSWGRFGTVTGPGVFCTTTVGGFLKLLRGCVTVASSSSMPISSKAVISMLQAKRN